MKFQPFVIADQKSGLKLNRDPWLLPVDAYVELSECYMFQGRIEKRRGQEVLAGLDQRVYDVDSSQIVTDTDAGEPVIDPLVNTSLPIVGLFQYQDNLGALQLIAMTTQRLFSFIPSLGVFIDMAGDNLWTGADSDFFCQDTWLNNMYLVNGVDDLHYYDGKHVWPVVIDPNGTGTNTVTGAVFVFLYYGRLVLLNTMETVTNVVDGADVTTTTRIPQQARWSDIGKPLSWSQQNYLAAPTQDTLVSAAILNGVLTAFFNNSVWILLYTQNYQLPFEWVRIPGVSGGTVSKKAVLTFSDQAVSIGPKRITGCDGVQCSYIDQNIPQFITEMNPVLFKYCYGLLHEKYSQLWLTYPSKDATTYPDKILVMNFDDKSWSTFNFVQSVLGIWDQEYDATTGALTAGYPQLLAGTRDGRVLLINQGGTDLDESVITATILTGQLSPFIKKGNDCNLGWVDLLVDSYSGGLVDVNFYADGYPIPYRSYTGIPLADGSGGTKSIIRIPVNCEAMFHQMKITHATEDQLVIHAVTWWCKEGGRSVGGGVGGGYGVTPYGDSYGD